MVQSEIPMPDQKKTKKLVARKVRLLSPNGVPLPETEIEPVRSEATQIEQLISMAIQNNVDLDKIERIIAMRDKFKAEQARDAFNTAMANFQAICPTIEKKKEAKNDQGKTLYSYAPLDSIVSQVKELLGANGFSYAIRVETGIDHVKVTCVVKHTMGHSEESVFDIPLSSKTGIMSAPQQVAATTTFAKRYAFLNAFGIMTGDEDNEKALEEKDLRASAIVEFEMKLRGAKTLDELKTIWISLPAMARKELETAKNETKLAIEGETVS